jgi:hypothetical protein
MKKGSRPHSCLCICGKQLEDRVRRQSNAQKHLLYDPSLLRSCFRVPDVQISGYCPDSLSPPLLPQQLHRGPPKPLQDRRSGSHHAMAPSRGAAMMHAPRLRRMWLLLLIGLCLVRPGAPQTPTPAPVSIAHVLFLGHTSTVYILSPEDVLFPYIRNVSSCAAMILAGNASSLNCLHVLPASQAK